MQGMRSSTISMLIAGVLVGIGGIAIGIYKFMNRTSHMPWFFWIAPLLAFGFALVMVQLVVMYWVKVGRLETKGRPKK
jgi:hypothetical protein